MLEEGKGKVGYCGPRTAITASAVGAALHYPDLSGRGLPALVDTTYADSVFVSANRVHLSASHVDLLISQLIQWRNCHDGTY